MRDRYDLIVVGAGPAGAACAYHAAAAGLSTLLVDRKAFPRAKVCGDGLTPRALRALSRMGLEDIARDSSRVLGVRFGSSKRSQTISYAATQPHLFTFGTVVPRVLLDDRVRRAAQRAGADFADDTTVTKLHTDRQGRIHGVYIERSDAAHQIESTVTVIADGAAGRLGRLLRRRSGCASMPTAFAVRQYVADVDTCAPYFEIHTPLVWRGRTLVGYAWIFPVTQTSANVGVGLLAPQLTLDEALLKRVFQDFLAELFGHDPRFRHARVVGQIEGGALNTHAVNPLDGPAGAILVGDAAGLVNAFTGEGIAYALESGEISAQAAIASREDDRNLVVTYGHSMLVAFRRHHVAGRSIRHAQWLASFGPSLFDRPSSNVLLDALGRFVLDEPPPALPRFSFEEPGRAGMVRNLLEDLRTEIVTGLQSIDPLVAEIAGDLIGAPSSAAMPLLQIVGATRDPQASRSTLFFDGLVTIVLFTLAHEVLSCVRGDRQHAHEPVNMATVAAIAVGDCLLTQASVALARLPADTSQTVADAFCNATCLRMTHTVPALATRYAVAAGATACAATLAQENDTLRSERVEADASLDRFARWYGSSWAAVADLTRTGSPELAEYVDAQIANVPRLPCRDRLPLNELAASLCEEAHRLIEERLDRPLRRLAAR